MGLISVHIQPLAGSSSHDYSCYLAPPTTGAAHTVVNSPWLKRLQGGGAGRTDNWTVSNHMVRASLVCGHRQCNRSLTCDAAATGAGDVMPAGRESQMYGAPVKIVVHPMIQTKGKDADKVTIYHRGYLVWQASSDMTEWFLVQSATYNNLRRILRLDMLIPSSLSVSVLPNSNIQAVYPVGRLYAHNLDMHGRTKYACPCHRMHYLGSS